MLESEAELAFMDEILRKLMAEDPNFNPDDLTPEMVFSLMGIPGLMPELPEDEEERQSSEEDFYQKIVDERTAEEKQARGKAEISSAAVDVLTARNVVDELSL